MVGKPESLGESNTVVGSLQEVSLPLSGKIHSTGAQSQHQKRSSYTVLGTRSNRCCLRGGGGPARWLSKLSICYTNPILEFLKSTDKWKERIISTKKLSSDLHTQPVTCGHLYMMLPQSICIYLYYNTLIKNVKMIIKQKAELSH